MKQTYATSAPGGGGPPVTPAALTKVDDTNVTLTLGGTPATALLQAVSITVGWMGTLADARIASAAYWNAKEPGITSGTTAQYWRGDKTWQTFPTIPTVTPAALTKVNDTNVTITLGGTPLTSLLQAVSLTVGWSGTLADSRVAGATKWNTKDKSVTFDGQSGVISINSKANFNIDFTGIVIGWQLFEISDTPISSTCVLDVWKVAYASYPSTVANTIFGTKPSLTGAIKNQATGLSIAVTSGDTFIVNIDSNIGAQRLLLVLQFNLS